jgi:hypothetical protein
VDPQLSRTPRPDRPDPGADECPDLRRRRLPRRGHEQPRQRDEQPRRAHRQCPARHRHPAAGRQCRHRPDPHDQRYREWLRAL